MFWQVASDVVEVSRLYIVLGVGAPDAGVDDMSFQTDKGNWSS